ncbi:hypothetical protein MSAN_01980100 [Mycena sanguinolenta]|uniref:Uncharacterized protein n=1 Tax=Mycena sanguinolenta TaxID=230812 RepID=A0A8H6XNG6_9AGAR|nr:hypothetical protein MSAN_01980100 [Mycena sanguinolenta]
MKRILNGIKSFRLGYAEERPYPWRWTTSIVLCAFLLISPFLAVLNVPLSAYNIVQEFTYQPNDTLPTVFLGNLVPSVLKNPTDSFTPQLLSVGETIVLDDNIFNYTISQAFDGIDTSKPVSTFPYYNNPLSDGCDVANITIQVQLTEDPTFYHLIRLDLGVIVDNQIYNSPQMFNRTIGSIDTEFYSLANAARNSTSNAMLMEQWQREVEFFQHNTRVPPLEYLRSVPRLKPLGSAVTGVFVSTFAILSVMWTAFSLVAGALARAHRKAPHDTTGKKHTLEESRNVG